MDREPTFNVVMYIGRYVDDPPTVKPGIPLNLAAATPCQRELGLQPSPIGSSIATAWGVVFALELLSSSANNILATASTSVHTAVHVDGSPMSPPTHADPKNPPFLGPRETLPGNH